MFKKAVTKLMGSISKRESTPQKPDSDSSDDDIDEQDSDEDDSSPMSSPSSVELNFDVEVEIGGGKGWPLNVTVVFYHKIQGLICAGTDGGAVFTYGDGFQFVRPWLQADANSVVAIVATGNDSVLVTFADNSLAVLSLPTLNVIDLLDAAWLSQKTGQITCTYSDECGRSNFVYFGTSEGYVYVADIQGSIRVCEYLIKPSELGLNKPMAIIDLQICPKDERYLGIGLSGSSKEAGTAIIFNLEKKKVKQSYATAAVTSISWNHPGDVLYAGTQLGALLYLGTEKVHCSEVWNASTQSASSGDDLLIRRLVWLAPQKPSEPGCLFLLLGVLEEGLGVSSSADALTSSLVGLAPIGAHGELDEVYSVPPFPTEEIVGFRLVPTVEKLRGPDATPTPALLLLTHSLVSYDDEDEDDQDEDADETRKGPRQLKIVRCPACDIQDWALEMANREDPRKATEVLPANAEVKSIIALSPPTQSNSLTAVLVESANTSTFVSETVDTSGEAAVASDGDDDDDNEEEGGDEFVVKEAAHAAPSSSAVRSQRRLSTRDFLSHNVENSGDIEVFNCSWELVLASLAADDLEAARKRLQDVVMLGHEDGSVIAWGVFSPEAGQELGRSNKHIPLRAFRCGSAEVTCLAHDDGVGLFAAGDIAGCVVMWEVYDEEKSLGASTRLRTLKKKKATVTSAAVVAAMAEGGEDEGDESGAGGGEGTEESTGDTGSTYFRPSVIREAMRQNVGEGVSAILVIGAATIMAVGTSEGSLFFTDNYCEQPLRKVVLTKVGARGGVSGFLYSGFYYDDATIPAIFVFFESGHIAVVSTKFACLVAYAAPSSKAAKSSKAKDDDDDDEDKATAGGGGKVVMAAACVVDGASKPLPRPDPNAEGALERSPSPGAVEAAAAVPPPLATKPAINSPAAPPLRNGKAFFGKFFSSSNSSISSTASQTPSPDLSPRDEPSNAASNPAPLAQLRAIEAKQVVVPESGPKYLLVVAKTQLVTYDLAKFSYLTNPGSSSFTKSSAAALSSLPLSSSPFVAGCVATYVEEASRAWATPEPCFNCIDNTGTLMVVSIQGRKPICSANLLEGVAPLNEHIQSGFALPSGSCYMLKNEFMLQCASVTSTSHRLGAPLPVRVPTVTCPPPSEMNLLSGREEQQAAAKATLKKRRQSVMSSLATSAPVDLDKLFSKTRSQLQKDELLGNAKDTSIANSKTAKATSKAASTMSDMSEVGEALAERGERLNRLAEKMDQFKQSSQEYRKDAKAHNDKLREKSKKWGLGLF